MEWWFLVAREEQLKWKMQGPRRASAPDPKDSSEDGIRSGSTQEIKADHRLSDRRLNSSDGWKGPEMRELENMGLLRWASFSVFCTCLFQFLKVS